MPGPRRAVPASPRRLRPRAADHRPGACGIGQQITQRGHSVAEVSARLGVSQHSLYKWIKEQQLPPGQHKEQLSQTEELRRLKAELKRVSEERDILKIAAAYFAKLSG